MEERIQYTYFQSRDISCQWHVIFDGNKINVKKKRERRKKKKATLVALTKRQVQDERERERRVATAIWYNLWITMQKLMERKGKERANLLDIHGDEYNAR